TSVICVRNICMFSWFLFVLFFFFFQAEDGIRDGHVTGVQTCALPIYVFLSSAVTQTLNTRNVNCTRTSTIPRRHQLVKGSADAFYRIFTIQPGRPAVAC